MALDLIISGGTVIDGTGSPGYRADVGVRDGRIVAVGEIADDAKVVIDATNRVVAPGFIDMHTHYDAQVFWDPKLSPSCYHGVTTVIGGNCGFSVAPATGKPEDADYLTRLLARVEGMPLESLQASLKWDWRSFSDYLGKVEGRVALNAGFLVGHCALRRAVMGTRAVGEAATEADIAAMQDLLRKSISEGGFGFSSSQGPSHCDGDGNPVPSRYAEDEELFALASVVSEFEGTEIEYLPDVIDKFDDATIERMTKMSLLANRPLNWNLLITMSDDPERHESQMAASDYARSKGAAIYGLAAGGPPTSRLNLVTGVMFDSYFPGWEEVLRLPLEERIQAFADPAVRKHLQDSIIEGGGTRFYSADWENWTVDKVYAEHNKWAEGKSVGFVAEKQGKKPLDAMLDIAVDDKLRTLFIPPVRGDDDESWQMRGKAWLDERTLVGGSDAGAHLDMIESFALTTTVLGEGVRRRSLLSVEQAVFQLTGRIAGYLGLRDRGRIETGFNADLVIFDPDTVDRGPLYPRHDLPNSESARLYAEAVGIHNVIVNGVEIVRDGTFLDKFPGKVLRSGVDSHSVDLKEGLVAIEAV